MKFAWVENNKIRDIAVNPAEQFTANVAENYNVEVDDSVQNGWELIDGIWTAPAVVEPTNMDTYLYVTYPELSTVNSKIDLQVSVKFSDGSPVQVQSTYYVPVIRLSDNKQEAFLTVNFVNGVANTSFTPSEPGVYIMDTDKIRPIPTSIIVDHPEIIVTG
jgi:hypothetical protein